METNSKGDRFYFGICVNETQDRRNLLAASTGMLLLVSLLFFESLWLAERNFPTVSIFSRIVEVPPAFHYVLYQILILISVLAIFKWKGRTNAVTCALIFFFALSCSLDILRLQPSIYLSLAVLLLVLVDKSKVSIQLAFVLIYIWIGLQKLNYNFIEFGFAKLFSSAPGILQPWMRMLAVLAALYEFAIGVLLFFAKTRNLGVILGTLLHFVILLTLGPLFLKWEPFVWPWNLWMISSLWILFYNTENRLISGASGKAYLIVFILFFIAPISNLFGWWNDYLSFKFYSSNVRSAAISFKPNSPWIRHEFFKNAIVSKNRINIAQWGLVETDAPEFPNEWYYEDFFFQVCKRLNADNDKSISLLMYDIPNRFTGQTVKKEVFCPDQIKTF